MSTAAIGFELSTSPEPEAAATLLRAILDFNEALAGSAGQQPISVLVRDPETGATRGGLIGRVRYSWLFVETFFLPEDLRGGGLGARILAAAEEEARAQGCIGAYLDTNSFQAPGFYEKQGYSRFGTLPDYPVPGFAKLYYMKRFAG
ncbi:GNAT family N-acetyltransferase [Roseomonas marmotae]|uniref:GNAT family N-acetyltransferase n=1 Tax=Roseomonas marmotae TaxID=2768161 RepID=A0ABS3KG24_9PROT|nr:GNAT family N-acetyltransferase [Roseomonas marmotae]MBO1076421.1 GNAT family N-acetyltransferase [Roseomonas marmotae]QTI79376.1 GNAT family N-acetyltransferase [Roseomonas marmotae]